MRKYLDYGLPIAGIIATALAGNWVATCFALACLMHVMNKYDS